LLKNNELPCLKIGTDWRFSRKAIDDWIRDKISRFTKQ
jgi:excisionase family DNA binding protein